MVVSLDLAVTFIIVIALLRLKNYEKLTVSDLRNQKLRIQDFTVFMKEIPLKPEQYNNNPELLRAMMTTHMEGILSNEPQVIHELENEQDNEAQITSIHFSMTSHNVMQYLACIYETIKQIQRIKLKMKNDPINKVRYERQLWQLCNLVTDYKEKYYLEK